MFPTKQGAGSQQLMAASRTALFVLVQTPSTEYRELNLIVLICTTEHVLITQSLGKHRTINKEI